MGRLTRKQRVAKRWSDFLLHNEGKDIDKLPSVIETFEKLYGPLPLIVSIRFFQTIKQAWLTNSSVDFRNKLYHITKTSLGPGYANELNRISNKRTW